MVARLAYFYIKVFSYENQSFLSQWWKFKTIKLMIQKDAFRWRFLQKQLKTFSCQLFFKKTLPQMFDRVLDTPLTEQKMKFSIMNFCSKCDQIRSFLQIWSHLLKESLMENLIFCTVSVSVSLGQEFSGFVHINISKPKWPYYSFVTYSRTTDIKKWRS